MDSESLELLEQCSLPQKETLLGKKAKKTELRIREDQARNVMTKSPGSRLT